MRSRSNFDIYILLLSGLILLQINSINDSALSYMYFKVYHLRNIADTIVLAVLALHGLNFTKKWSGNSVESVTSAINNISGIILHYRPTIYYTFG